MNVILSDFEKRVEEVNNYFNFVKLLTECRYQFYDDKNEICNPHCNDRTELIKTLKASCYLLLYNLVESTMRNVVEQIFDEFRTGQIRYDVFKVEIKKVVLGNFRRRNIDKILPKLVDFARDVVVETFDSEELFSGNLDARMIRETAERFGFDAPPTTQGWKLLSVKNARNDLAHGIKSFSEVGRDISIKDLEMARDQVVEILTTTITNVSKYINQQEYIDFSVGQVSGR